MNDLELLKETVQDTPLPWLDELGGARAQLVAAIAAEYRATARPTADAGAEPAVGTGAATAVGTPVATAARRRWQDRRLVTAGAALVAAVVVAATVIVASQATRASSPQASRPSGAKATPATSASPALTFPATAHLTAALVLHRAAVAVLSQPAVTPSPDQFVYTKIGARAGDPVVQTWLSVDGKKNGLTRGGSENGTILGCANGYRQFRLPGTDGKPYKGPAKPKKPVPMDGPVTSEPCTPTPTYFPDMPTNPNAMLAYLEQAQGIRPGDLNDLGKTVAFLMEDNYLLPAQQAALYEFIAKYPGMTVTRNVTDVSGRPGIGVGWSLYLPGGVFGGKTMIIFDARTYAYLGLTTWGEQGQVGGDALLQIAIVNQAGQLP